MERNGGGSPPPFLHREYWEFRPEWLEYVKRSWQGKGRVELVHDDAPERVEFEKRARQAFLEQDIPCSRIKTYLSVQLPGKGCGYDTGYPHTHEPSYAVTLVNYLQPAPAALDIFDGDTVIESILPEIGMTVFIPNHVKHGVRINQSDQSRIQFIATALR